MRKTITLLFMSLSALLFNASAQFTTDGVYTIQNVGTTKYMAVNSSNATDVRMDAALSDFAKFSIVKNVANSTETVTKYNIISKDNNLLAFDGSNVILQENTEDNRNLASALFSFPTEITAVNTTAGVQSLAATSTVATSPSNFIEYANANNTITGLGRLNGQKSSNADVGSGYIAGSSYQWTLTRVSDLTGINRPQLTKVAYLATKNGVEFRSLNQGEELSIYSMTGAKVFGKKIESSVLAVDLAKGIYMVRIADKASKVVVK